MTGPPVTQLSAMLQRFRGQPEQRILFLAPDTVASRHTGDVLATAGFELTFADNAVQGLAAVGAGMPDLILLDMAAPKDLQDLPASLAQRSGFAKIPVLALAERADLVQVAQSDHPDDIILGRFGPELVLNRIKGLTRLATLREELELRRESVEVFQLVNAAPDAPRPDRARPRILMTAVPPDQLGPLTETAGPAADIGFVSDRNALRHRAQEGPCDAVILGSADGVQGALSTLSDLRLYPNLYHLPVLVADGCDEGARFDEKAACEAGATDVIRGHDNGQTIALKLSTQIALQSQRNGLRADLALLRREAIADSLSGLFSHGFLHQHIDAHLDRAAARGRPVTVGVFVINHLNRLNADCGYAAGDHLIRQISGILAGLIREEDCAGRIDGNMLGILLPNTSIKDARLVLHRIAGVANHTSLTVLGCDQPFRPQIFCGAAEASEGNRARDLIEQARQQCYL